MAKSYARAGTTNAGYFLPYVLIWQPHCYSTSKKAKQYKGLSDTAKTSAHMLNTGAKRLAQNIKAPHDGGAFMCRFAFYFAPYCAVLLKVRGLSQSSNSAASYKIRPLICKCAHVYLAFVPFD